MIGIRGKLSIFSNEKNPHLVSYLKEDALNDDIEDITAVYLVLDSNHDDEIVLYFGLKCGMISLPFPSEVLKLFDDEKEELLKNMPEDKLEVLDYIRLFIQDAEQKHDINKVARTIQGIELSHFCINQQYRENRDKENDNTKGIGEYLFYEVIMPIVYGVKDHVGCKFLYLFAADSSDDLRLIRNYREHLGFMSVEEFDANDFGVSDVIPIMPFYDYTCEFMIMPL